MRFARSRGYKTPGGFSPPPYPSQTRRGSGVDVQSYSGAPTIVTPGEIPPMGLPDRFIFDPTRFGNAPLVPFTVGTLDVLLLPAPEPVRSFLFILNTHATQTIYVGFGTIATPSMLPLQPNGGSVFYDVFVPQDDIHVIGSGAGTTGVYQYSNIVIS